MKQKSQIPRWIYFFGGFLAVFGFTLGIMGYLMPDMVISGFTGDTNAHEMAMWMTSARNVAMGAVLAISLFSKKAELIGLAFIMRLITEFLDMPATAVSGVMGVPAAAVYAVYILLFIIPEILVIKKMWSIVESNKVSI